MSLDNFDIQVNAEILQSVTPDQAWHYGVVPLCVDETGRTFYISELTSEINLKHELEFAFNCKVNFKKINENEFKTLLHYSYRRNDLDDIVNIDSSDYVANLIYEAERLKSSDIHIEPFKDQGRVRFRVDGKLIERFVFGAEEFPAVVNKVKIKANLDIAEKRLPQDGRIQFSDAGFEVDIRVSILPTLYGEKIVLRLLGRNLEEVKLEDLGFNQRQLVDYMEATKRSNGLVLISGPTGSGKTTTLYGTLRILNQTSLNILTIEDPIEYTIGGVNQVQLNEAIGLTFSRALRTFLRQDPDIIMLGEIRDPETAEMAVRASLTGHLVLSTIHTNSAWGTVSRLLDMGVSPFLLSNTLTLSVAQRLVRLLCPSCKKEAQLSENLFPAGYNVDRKFDTHYVPVGCPNCHYTGFKGRTALFEIVPIKDEFINAIRDNETLMNRTLRSFGISMLSDSAIELVESGLSSICEIYSILSDAQ